MEQVKALKVEIKEQSEQSKKGQAEQDTDDIMNSFLINKKSAKTRVLKQNVFG